LTLYRFSLLDRSDRIKALETFECHDDDEAEDFADRLLRSSGYIAVEIWEGTERIHRTEMTAGRGAQAARNRRQQLAVASRMASKVRREG
jgi:hypothetical protein